MEASGQFHAPTALPPVKNPHTHWLGYRMSPRRQSRCVEELNLCQHLNQTPIQTVLWLNKCVRTCETACLLPFSEQCFGKLRFIPQPHLWQCIKRGPLFLHCLLSQCLWFVEQPAFHIWPEFLLLLDDAAGEQLREVGSFMCNTKTGDKILIMIAVSLLRTNSPYSEKKRF